MSPENPLLLRAISLGGNKNKIIEFYDDWADTYDTDMIDTIGYVGHIITAEALAALVSDGAEILDAGCGTGLVAVELKKRNVSLRIDGIDLTQGMLDEAAETHAYRELIVGDLMGKLDFSDNSYDGIVSAGVYTNGHVGPTGLDELVRVAKPGAPIVLTVRDTAWEADGFRTYIDDLAAKGLIRIREIRHSPYHGNEGIFCQLCILEAV
ncbi:class I SAM-dependent DNA methyltransferase [Roseibium aggregatum]|uniref:Methyltransferase domain-containing protein n=1 Tax=Roseibium aggregatum TaxID=187304 RepID=A0A926P3H2_9HYPH|nr:class I SAM-dependent methyltransferase [Roseibium aggregatum]MBD1548943.1 methyltransferase domain-containing protein [Roseibium aggregatum]